MPKNSLNITFNLIIVAVRLIELLMLCHIFLREARAKKKSFLLRILKFFIACRLY